MKKIISIILALALIIALAACGAQQSGQDSGQTSPGTNQTDTGEKYSVSVGFLKGPTGIGAAYLMEQNEAGECENNYSFTIESDPTAINSALISKTLDIAAVPTNVAAALYNKTGGNIKIIAVNTMNVLYVLENGDTVSSVSDLKGRTIYTTGQGANPEYVLNYILKENGLEPGTDVTVEFKDSAELATLMASGSVDLCMLPVPNATSVLLKNSNVRVALNIGDEWEKIAGGDSVLTQGCIVVRADLENLDEIVARFLEDYEVSINYISSADNIDAAAELAVKYEIVGTAEIAKAAIPDSGLVFISGADNIRELIDGYYEVLYDANPTSIGGTIPDEGFYYQKS